jgi:MFS family permease
MRALKDLDALEQVNKANNVAQPATFSASSIYRRYVLFLLVAVGVCSWVDRNVFSILLQAIKTDFSLSDTQLGLLGGTAFGLFYASLGLPMALVADRRNRRNLISFVLVLWSLMTAFTGMATGVLTLFLSRIGVALGEAGGIPPCHSLVSDYFPPERRGLAMGILNLYVPLGFLVSFLLGGWINQYFGWRMAFLVVGAPGILLAILLRFTLREPPHGYSEGARDTGLVPSLFSTIQHCFRTRAIRHIAFGGAIHGLGAWAMGIWLPPYFMRVHGTSSGEVGTWMAAIYGLGGAIGALFGGCLADRIFKKTGDKRWYLWCSSIALTASTPLTLLVFLSSTARSAFLFLIIPMILMYMYLGPATAMIQNLAGLRMRAVSAAFYLFLSNLISLGLGPLLVGMASDYLNPRYGAYSLRYALIAMVFLTFPWAAIHFCLAARSLREDLAHTQLTSKGS